MLARIILTAVVAMSLCDSALAGMPSPFQWSISESSKIRLETVSFFLTAFLLSALGVKFLWNSLSHDFPILPRITYGKSLAFVTLWGLLFTIVLTMISGARELMTPGAWEQNGITFKVIQSGDGKAGAK